LIKDELQACSTSAADVMCLGAAADLEITSTNSSTGEEKEDVD